MCPCLCMCITSQFMQLMTVSGCGMSYVHIVYLQVFDIISKALKELDKLGWKWALYSKLSYCQVLYGGT